MISVTSSTTPVMVENSCSTPSILNEVIAKPSNEDKILFLMHYQLLRPKPGSKGLNSNLPEKSVDSIIITLSGFLKI